MRQIDADALVYELTEMVRYNTGEYKHGIAAARLVVMDAPTIGGWISVNDRLPTERDGTVLVCYPNQSPYNLLEPHMNAKHDRRVSTGCYSQHSCTWYHGDMCGVGGADPIAWMPLPEPAKEGT